MTTGTRQTKCAARRWTLAAMATALATGAALLCSSPSASASPSPSAAGSAVCTWGGAPLHPTGTFTTNPGLTFLPESSEKKFFATGPLSGPSPRCRGQMTWRGVAIVEAETVRFKGDVEGLPGVAHFEGPPTVFAVAPAAVPSELFDAGGKRVGIENASLISPDNFNASFLRSGFTREGLTGAPFSSVIVLY